VDLDLSDDAVRAALADRGTSPVMLARIARSPRWTRDYSTKRELVRHAATPPIAARALVHHLRWRDLAEVASDLRVHPTVRARAERVLTQRLQELSLGERVALARSVVRGLVAPLLALGGRGVPEALLGNPRLTEPDVVALAASPSARRALLERIAAHPAWGGRLAVRLALVRQPRTPSHLALALLRSLPKPQVRVLAGEPEIPRIVRVSAERTLARGPGSDR